MRKKAVSNNGKGNRDLKGQNLHLISKAFLRRKNKNRMMITFIT